MKSLSFDADHGAFFYWSLRSYFSGYVEVSFELLGKAYFGIADCI